MLVLSKSHSIMTIPLGCKALTRQMKTDVGY